MQIINNRMLRLAFTSRRSRQTKGNFVPTSAQESDDRMAGILWSDVSLQQRTHIPRKAARSHSRTLHHQDTNERPPDY
jgi:hypothetical protein